MTIGETADYLNLSPLTVQRLARSRAIPAFKVGRQWRVKRELLGRFLEENRAETALHGKPVDSAKEPEQLQRGKAFHASVQQEWQEEADGQVTVEGGVIKPGGRKGRVDVLVLVDADNDLVAVVEVKSSDWDRMTQDSVRRNVRRQAQQVWDYIDSQLAKGKEVSPGIVFPGRPKSPKRLALIEDLFDEAGIAVVWQDETTEERKARADRSNIP